MQMLKEDPYMKKPTLPMVYGGFCSLKGILQTLFKASGNNVRGLFY